MFDYTRATMVSEERIYQLLVEALRDCTETIRKARTGIDQTLLRIEQREESYYVNSRATE